MQEMKPEIGTLFRHGTYHILSKTYEWLKVERNILIEREIDD